MARILFIDDDENIRFLLAEELRTDGHEVLTAPDGPSGLEALDLGPELVILDIKMPGMDGMEVLRRIKARDPALPVLLFTAYTEPEEGARALGADGYLVKSADLQGLRETVARLCRRPGPGPGS